MQITGVCPCRRDSPRHSQRETSTIVVSVRFERTVSAHEPLVGFAVVTVPDRIVATPIPPIVLRMPEPI